MKRLARLVAATAMAFAATVALGQIPDGLPPGSICVTPTFWCYAATSGRVGTPCTCPSAQGLVAGTYL